VHRLPTHPAPTQATPPATYTSADWIAVAAGGALGTGARAVLMTAWPTAAGTLPWTTLAINLGGALALGLLVGVLSRAPAVGPWRSPFFTTGVLGSFTTFSALAFDLTAMATDRPGGALAYATASVAGGVVAALVGWRLGRLAFERTRA
jgi:fluoride exporter